MPRYEVELAFDCSHYGDLVVEADSPEHLLDILKQKFVADELNFTADPAPEVGTENWRIVTAVDLADKDGECYLEGEQLSPPANGYPPRFAVVELLDGDVQEVKLFFEEQQAIEFVAECIRIYTNSPVVFLGEVQEHFEQHDSWKDGDYSLFIHPV